MRPLNLHDDQISLTWWQWLPGLTAQRQEVSDTKPAAPAGRIMYLWQRWKKWQVYVHCARGTKQNKKFKTQKLKLSAFMSDSFSIAESEIAVFVQIFGGRKTAKISGTTLRVHHGWEAPFNATTDVIHTTYLLQSPKYITLPKITNYSSRRPLLGGKIFACIRMFPRLSYIFQLHASKRDGFDSWIGHSDLRDFVLLELKRVDLKWWCLLTPTTYHRQRCWRLPRHRLERQGPSNISRFLIFLHRNELLTKPDFMVKVD